MAVTQPSSNTGASLVLLICIIAAIRDVFYWKHGGARTPKRTVARFWRSLLFFVALSIVFLLLGYGAVGGDILGVSLNIIICLWEFTRWQIRRVNPIGIPKTN